ncbi:MAG TPA: hypothetical protein ENK12_03355 [Gammaproteobacteria bacterium]|nr:hypothetical protein [Gammaproteobacteria bacterium]
MKSLHRHLAFAVLLYLLPQPPALAVLSNPRVLPAQANVALNRTARVSVNWRFTTDAGPAVQSPGGVLDDGSTVFLNVDRPLSAPAGRAGIDPVTGLPVSQTVTLRETLTLPAAVLSRAFNQGVTRLFYTRQFSDANGTLSATLVLHITGSAAAGFNVNYLGLRFEDGSLRRLVERDDALRARAVVRFSGAGQLQGVWEIADPSSASGTPVFRTLRVVRQALFGGQSATLTSPPLPTGRAGLYRLRLRVTQPRLDQDVPVLHYFVRGQSGPVVQRIELREPADDAPLRIGTAFRWRPLAGVSAYRLEIYPPASGGDGQPPGRPLTGMLVGGRREALNFSPLAWRHLAPGGRYRWRLIAIDAAGRVIGRSEDRRLRVTADAPPAP